MPEQARKLLWQAIVLPLSHPGELVKLFWPTFAILAVSILRWSIASTLGEWAEIVWLIVVLIALFATTAVGLVRWHRWCVLGEPITAFDFSFGKREWDYWLFWLVLGVWLFVYLLLIGLPLILIGMGLVGPDEWARNSLLAFAFTILASAITVIVFARSCGFYATRLVAIAIDEPERGKAIANSQAELANRYPWFWQPLAAIMLVSSLLGELGKAPLETSQSPLSALLAAGASWIVMLIGFVVFATALSLFYRDYLAAKPTGQTVSDQP